MEIKNKAAFILSGIAALLLFTRPLPAPPEKDAFQITTIKDIVKNMVDKYETIRTYAARFTIRSKIESVESVSRGTVRYRAPDNFIMVYSEPQDQIIFSDGKVLKIYVPELNILGEQDLEHYKPGFLISGKTSLFYLRNKYHISFHKSNKPALIGGTPHFVLLLEQKDVTAGFKKIILYVNQHWVIVKAEGTTLNENSVSISFSDIVLNSRITDEEFNFNLPVNTQTIKNPLLLKIEGE